MIRRSLFFSMFVCFFVISSIFPLSTFGDTTARILVLPFEVNSQKDLSYLKNQIPEIISVQLKKDGGIIADLESLNITEALSSELPVSKIREVAEAAKAEYVVWGTLTRVGKKISLDVKFLDMSDAGNIPEYIYSEGDDIDSLLSTVNKVSMTIGIKAFKLEAISEIVIKGNDRIEDDAILRVISTKPGDRFHKAKLTEDLKKVYAMGYFDDIRIEADREGRAEGAGTTVVFTVKEKPTIKNIKIKGNSAFDNEKIKKEITITPGSILNSSRIKANIKQIESLYEEKHYINTKVTYKTYPKENNQADLEFIIEEGEKVRIKEIKFIGNSAFEDKKLRKMIKTKEKGFFSWLTSSGVLDMADLNTDVAIIGGTYQKEGFIDVKVGEPKVDYEGEWIFITIKIDEGLQYKVGNIDITGDLLEEKKGMIKKLNIGKEEFCNKEEIQKDVISLTDKYADQGYAAAKVNPRLHRDKETKTANIEFNINKENLVYFEKIIIGGNVVTRDKVIRRELQVYEQELYSGTKMKRSVRNLYRLDYFEDVQVNTVRGSSEDKMSLIIDVKEKPTGTFTFGMGYSSQDKLFGTLAVAKRNLFGRGQTLNLQGEFGQKANKYSISFTEPWLFDIPLSARAELMDWEREYDTYDKATVGGGLKFGYPIFDYTSLYAGYTYEINDITITDPGASSDITDYAGSNVTRSLSTTLHYDSRDRGNTAQTTEGSDCSITAKYAGGILGGDISFSKYTATAGRYFPLFFSFIGFLHSEVGFAKENDRIEEVSGLPDYEKFYLGGMTSVRGFEWHGIHLEDENGFEVGGEQFLQFNGELLRPLFKMEGLLGMVFYDAGNVFHKDDRIDVTDLRQSYGFGIKWFSPIGPINFVRAYIVDPRGDEPKNGKWDFTMGGTF